MKPALPCPAPFPPLEAPHARSWGDVVRLAQVGLAAQFASAIGAGRFGTAEYRHWLAMESAVCRIGALSLDMVARWHVAQPGLCEVADDWAARLRALAIAATADMNALPGPPPGYFPPLGEWLAFAHGVGASQRVGELLGAALLHSRLLSGPMRPVLGAIAGLAFVGHEGQYLLRRWTLASEPLAPQALRLLDAYAASAIAVGAQRAAHWYAAAIAPALAVRPPLSASTD